MSGVRYEPGVAGGFPHVQGKCPACGCSSLFYAKDGYVTCGSLDCSDPCSASEALGMIQISPNSSQRLEVAMPESLPGTSESRLAGADLIANERERQTAEGWTPDHDDSHTLGELAQAAVCYALPPGSDAPRYWPWEPKSWKPSRDGDRVQDLVKAGALIAAEIDRLRRAGL